MLPSGRLFQPFAKDQKLRGTGLWAAVVANHRSFFVLLAGYAASDYFLAELLKRPGPELWSSGIMEFSMLPFGALLTILIYGIWVLAKARPERPVLYLLDLFRKMISAERLANGLAALLILGAFAAAFGSFKNMIPALHPFTWDVALSDLSQRLHGGALPYQWLQPVLQVPFVTMLLDRAYGLWFCIMWVLLVWQAFSTHDPATRRRFFLSFGLCWSILGTIGAVLMSSAGPCFYGLVVGEPNPYAPLMNYLHEADRIYPLFALKAQAYLWNAYIHGLAEPASGISAMPSMHVSMAVLFALLGWWTNRLLGVLLTAFAVTIFFASIELGWHYAPDGYLAALGTLAIWFAAEPLQRHLLIRR